MKASISTVEAKGLIMLMQISSNKTRSRIVMATALAFSISSPDDSLVYDFFPRLSADIYIVSSDNLFVNNRYIKFYRIDKNMFMSYSISIGMKEGRNER